MDRTASDELSASQGLALIKQSKDLVAHICRARVAMPKSTRELVERCERYRSASAAAVATTQPGGLAEPPRLEAGSLSRVATGDGGPRPGV